MLRQDPAVVNDFLSPPTGTGVPFCPFFGGCGGCAFQHLTEGEYETFKQQRITAALREAGLFKKDVEYVFFNAHGSGRRRLTLHARSHPRGGASYEVGFMAAKSHRLVPITRCPVAHPALKEAPGMIKDLLGGIAPRPSCDIHLIALDEKGPILCAFKAKGELSAQEKETMSAQGSRYPLASLVWNGQWIARWAPARIQMGKAYVEIPPQSFLQATACAESYLGAFAQRALKRAQHPFDLFCGVGPFALRLAEQAPVHAFDGDRQAIAALQGAIKGAVGLKPITALERDLFRMPLGRQELRLCDGLLLNPPRQGAQAQIEALLKADIPRVVMFYCDLLSFVRDAKRMCDGGYFLEKIHIVDQFRWTAHSEFAALFLRT